MYPLKKIKRFILFSVCSISLNTLAQQDGFLENFVEIKTERHHFYIGKYPIATGEYNSFMEFWDNPKTLTDEQTELPALVTKEGAESYLNYISDVYFTPFRLPTEAEWELAATGTPAPSKSNVLRCVSCMEPNSNGLHGMLGNAWEWTSTPEPEENDRYFVIKGGDFQERPKDLSPQTRFVVSSDMTDMNIGFRPVLSVSGYEKVIAVDKANKLIKELLPEKDIEINRRGIFDEDNAHYFDDSPETILPISVDEEEMVLVICCVESMTFEDENMDSPKIEYVGVVYEFAPNLLPLAMELQRLAQIIKGK